MSFVIKVKERHKGMVMAILRGRRFTLLSITIRLDTDDLLSKEGALFWVCLFLCLFVINRPFPVIIFCYSYADVFILCSVFIAPR